MKVERKEIEPKFEPIVITLESQEDVDTLKDLVGRVVNLGVGREFTSRLYWAIDPHSNVKQDTYFSGVISSKDR